jgi:hypothetical protein
LVPPGASCLAQLTLEPNGKKLVAFESRRDGSRWVCRQFSAGERLGRHAPLFYPGVAPCVLT